MNDREGEKSVRPFVFLINSANFCITLSWSCWRSGERAQVCIQGNHGNQEQRVHCMQQMWFIQSTSVYCLC